MYQNDSYFKYDSYRQELASDNKLNELKKSYSKKVSKNTNTSKFWDKKISKGHKLDPLTKDRIQSSVSLIKEKTGNLLDIGVGYGDFEKTLYKKNKKILIHGIDISLKGLNKLKKIVPGTYRKGTVLDIPFKDKTFEIVVALEILEHISSNKIFKAYKEISRIMKKNGVFILSVPVNEKYTLRDNPNRHMRAYSPKLITSELSIAGFKILRIKQFYAFKRFYLMKKNIQKLMLRKRWKPNIVLISCTKK
jgi:2-polyprenyl-3-methyl-5-hydroxy-6-metoxy-1,4-benzoquinol methylase